ncbi:MAG: hypothetical protein V3W41_08770 [Planctomycetota bacterium]
MKYLFCVVAALALCCQCSVPESQAAVEAMDLKALSLRAPLIVKGTISSSRVQWARDQRGEMIVTNHVVQVSEVLKGSMTGSDESKLTLQCLGGSIGDMKMLTAAEPSVRAGESVVLFLMLEPEANSGVYKTYGGFQGKYTLLGNRVREARNRDWTDFRSEVLSYIASKKK